MTPVFSGNAVTSIQDSVPEMEVSRTTSAQKRESSSNTTSERAIAQRKLGSPKKTDKQSLDYALRSGLAGGLAGCAVCRISCEGYIVMCGC